jgi:hypothetical protein
MDRLHAPVTVCTVCHAPGHIIAAVSQRCSRVYKRNGKQDRCQGVMQSAIGVMDWGECPSCNATGWEGALSKRCTQCDSAGWIFVREAP